MRRIFAIAAIAVACLLDPGKAAGHSIPSTKREQQAGVRGRIQHLERALWHQRGAYRVCKAARVLVASQDCRWHWRRYRSIMRTLPELRRRLDPWANLRARIPAFYWHAFVHLIHPCELHTWYGVDYPYYGGLQMDLSFQRSYGSWALARWGTADNWPMVVQVYVAYRAAGPGGRGFYPWPTCAARAGLI